MFSSEPGIFRVGVALGIESHERTHGNLIAGEK
jgi:hypothetical protein